MIKQKCPSHSTRESAEYAAALLETGVDWRIRRATNILHAVLRLQDADESSRTYGIWPWFQEEPLEAMSPPDWNWADFIGTQLAQILYRGPSRSFVFRAAFPCALGLAVTVNAPGELERGRADIRGELLHLEWPVSSDETLQTAAPRFASSEAEITAFAQNQKRRRTL